MLPGWGVGVEDPVEHDLAEQRVEQAPRQRSSRFGRQARRGRQERSAVEILHHHHSLTAVRLVRCGHADVPVPGGGRGDDRRHVPRFDPQVQFLAQRAGEPLRQRDGPGGTPPPGTALKTDRQPLHDVQVGVHGAGHARPPDLHGDTLPGRQRGGVHLGDGSGRDRLFVNAGELLARRPGK
jgi:hypothetical protein